MTLVAFILHGSVDNSNETEIEVDDQNDKSVGGVHQQRHRKTLHQKVCQLVKFQVVALHCKA